MALHQQFAYSGCTAKVSVNLKWSVCIPKIVERAVLQQVAEQGICMVAVVLEEVSEEYAGKVDIYKINVDEEEELASIFGIRSIPTLIFVPMNGNMQCVQGAMGKTQLKGTIEDILLK